MPTRPLLLVDVDGVVSLFGFDPSRPPPGRFVLVDGIPHLISSTAGDHLRVLSSAFELAWCSGWEEKAGDYLPHLLGLETPIPHLTFTEDGGLGHWKLAAIERYAGPDRPLAWLDDGHNDACETWAAARRGPTLLLSTNSAVGVTEDEVERLLEWARAVV